MGLLISSSPQARAVQIHSTGDGHERGGGVEGLFATTVPQATNCNKLGSPVHSSHLGGPAFRCCREKGNAQLTTECKILDGSPRDLARETVRVCGFHSWVEKSVVRAGVSSRRHLEARSNLGLLSSHLFACLPARQPLHPASRLSSRQLGGTDGRARQVKMPSMACSRGEQT